MSLDRGYAVGTNETYHVLDALIPDERLIAIKPNEKIDIRKLRGAKASSPVTDDDREFMRQMADRMPNLSIRHNADPSAKDGDTRLDGGYLRKFRKD